MPTSVTSHPPTTRPARRVYLIPLSVLLAAALLSLLMYHALAAALVVLAPALVAACVAAALTGVLQRRIASRRAERRAPGFAAVAAIVDDLAAGRPVHSVEEIGRSWRTLDAARSMAATRSPEEQRRIREALRGSGVWRRVDERARSGQKWSRVRAIHDLGWLGVPDATPTICRALEDGDDDVAWAGIAALGGMEHDVAYQVLLDLLEDGRFAASRVAKVLDASRHPGPVPLLRARAADAPPRSLFWIAYLLGRTGGAESLPPLESMASHADANVRASAAEALGRTGAPRAEPLLLRMMDDDVWFVRLHAARALGDLRAPSGVRALQSAVRDPNWWVRRSAVDALERIRADAA